MRQPNSACISRAERSGSETVRFTCSMKAAGMASPFVRESACLQQLQAQVRLRSTGKFGGADAAGKRSARDRRAGGADRAVGLGDPFLRGKGAGAVVPHLGRTAALPPLGHPPALV